MALWDEKFQSTEEKQCADRILDAWDDSNVCPICIQHMENGHKCDKEDAPIHDQMAYVRQAIGRSHLLKQIKRAHERQNSAVDKTSPITMGENFENKPFLLEKEQKHQDQKRDKYHLNNVVDRLKHFSATIFFSKALPMFFSENEISLFFCLFK